MSWITEGSGRNAHAVNTSTSANNMRQHRIALRQQAEARNSVTPHERTSLHQKGKCICPEYDDQGINLTEQTQK